MKHFTFLRLRHRLPGATVPPGSPWGVQWEQSPDKNEQTKMTYLFQFVKTQILQFLFFLSFCWNYTIYQITFSDVSFNGTIFRL